MVGIFISFIFGAVLGGIAAALIERNNHEKTKDALDKLVELYEKESPVVRTEVRELLDKIKLTIFKIKF